MAKNKMTYVNQEIYKSYSMVSTILSFNIECHEPNEFTEEQLNAFKIVKEYLDIQCKAIEKEYK